MSTPRLGRGVKPPTGKTSEYTFKLAPFTPDPVPIIRLCGEVMKGFPHSRWRLSDILDESPEVMQLLGSRVRELGAGNYWFDVG